MWDDMTSADKAYVMVAWGICSVPIVASVCFLVFHLSKLFAH